MSRIYIFFGLLLLAVLGSAYPQFGLGLGARTPLASMGANANGGYYGGQGGYGGGYGGYGNGGYGGYGNSGYGGYGGTNAGLGANVAGIPVGTGLGLGLGR
ncbi:hypothetical protein FO519_008743 [Halicephalobus sp. NKZ332]|nr:hypothetical protein FO519_008743 [Halicephalobus sp. NKZ332]